MGRKNASSLSPVSGLSPCLRSTPSPLSLRVPELNDVDTSLFRRSLQSVGGEFSPIAFAHASFPHSSLTLTTSLLLELVREKVGREEGRAERKREMGGGKERGKKRAAKEATRGITIHDP